MERERSRNALARRRGESHHAHLARLEKMDLMALTPAEQAELVFQLCTTERKRRRLQESVLPFLAERDDAAAGVGERAAMCG
jgi:hypothetical protein